MAVFFEQAWPTVSGTISQSDLDSRFMAAAPGETKTSAQSFYWSDNGDDDGESLFADADCPWVAVVLGLAGGGVHMAGCYGPIGVAGDPALGTMYFWRTEYDGTASLWKTTVYTGGSVTEPTTAASTLNAQSANLRFIANCVTEDD